MEVEVVKLVNYQLEPALGVAISSKENQVPVPLQYCVRTGVSALHPVLLCTSWFVELKQLRWQRKWSFRPFCARLPLFTCDLLLSFIAVLYTTRRE